MYSIGTRDKFLGHQCYSHFHCIFPLGVHLSMDASSWLVFASIIALASLSPGPNVLAVIVNTLEGGARAAFFTVLGNLIALLSIALAAAVGVGSLLQAMPSVFTALKIAGGLYLACMGLKMLRSAYGKQAALDLVPTDGHAVKKTNIEYTARAVLISYSNPKSILFLSAVFPAFLQDAAALSVQFVLMLVTLIGVVTLVHSIYAVLAYRMKVGLVGVKARQYMSVLSGVSFLGFGAGFVYDAQR